MTLSKTSSSRPTPSPSPFDSALSFIFSLLCFFLSPLYSLSLLIFNLFTNGFLFGRFSVSANVEKEFISLLFPIEIRDHLNGQLSFYLKYNPNESPIVLHVGSPSPSEINNISLLIHDNSFFGRVILQGNLGFGETFMKGIWEFHPLTTRWTCCPLYYLARFLLKNRLGNTFQRVSLMDMVRRGLKGIRVIVNSNITLREYYRMIKGYKVFDESRPLSFMEADYGAANELNLLELYKNMLGPTMLYTCGFPFVEGTKHQTFGILPIGSSKEKENQNHTHHDDIKSSAPISPDHPLDSYLHTTSPLSFMNPTQIPLESMQLGKLRRIIEKLQVRDGMNILEIGCGYGSMGIFLAEHFHVNYTGFTLSSLMIQYATKRYQHEKENLKGTCEFINAHSNRFLPTLPSNHFDIIISIGMFEHIPPSDLPFIFSHLRRVLKDEGRALLHMMTSSFNPNQRDPFIQKYLFPNSNQQVVSDLVKQIEFQRMYLLDVEAIGTGYSFTLAGWRANLQEFFRIIDSNSDHGEHKYPHRSFGPDETLSLRDSFPIEFRRMFFYYLDTCMAFAVFGTSNLHHIVFAKKPNTMWKPMKRELLHGDTGKQNTVKEKEILMRQPNIDI